MHIKFRQSTIADAFPIADFSRRSFYESFADQNTAANMDKYMLSFSREMLAAEVQDPEHIFLLALASDSIVGYVKLSTSKKQVPLVAGNAVEIARIYVDQKMIGKGVGNQLMQRALDRMTDMETDVAWLGVWEHNANAIKFYTKWGFTKFGDHIFMLGDDPQTDWLMKKELRDPKA